MTRSVASRALTSIEFAYRGLDAVLIDRWSLRLVALRVDSVPRFLLRPLVRTPGEA